MARPADSKEDILHKYRPRYYYGEPKSADLNDDESLKSDKDSKSDLKFKLSEVAVIETKHDEVVSCFSKAVNDPRSYKGMAFGAVSGLAFALMTPLSWPRKAKFLPMCAASAVGLIYDSFVLDFECRQRVAEAWAERDAAKAAALSSTETVPGASALLAAIDSASATGTAKKNDVPVSSKTP